MLNLSIKTIYKFPDMVSIGNIEDTPLLTGSIDDVVNVVT